MTTRQQGQGSTIQVPSASQRRRPHPYQIMVILVMVGAILLLWAKPVAAAVTIKEFKVQSPGVPQGITVGPDGNLWFTLDNTDSTSEIGRITPSGTITEFTLPAPSNDYLILSGITTGPDGNLWFTYQDWNTHVSAVGRITTSGTITLFPTPTANSGPTDITAGPDGNLWFTEGVGKIGRATTS